MKSDILIKDDVYAHIKNSPLASAVTGKICKQGVRPKDSDKEDVVIAVIANLNGQIQEAAGGPHLSGRARGSFAVSHSRSAQPLSGRLPGIRLSDEPRVRRHCGVLPL